MIVRPPQQTDTVMTVTSHARGLRWRLSAYRPCGHQGAIARDVTATDELPIECPVCGHKELVPAERLQDAKGGWE